MPEPAAASSLTRHPSFVLFWCARTFTNGAYMMQGVAVGWQIYELTNDPFDLGLVGLAQLDRKSTRLNSSHTVISYAVFCLKKKNAEHDAEFQTVTGQSEVR